MYSLNAEGPRGKSDRVDGNMAGVRGGVEHQSGGRGEGGMEGGNKDTGEGVEKKDVEGKREERER